MDPKKNSIGWRSTGDYAKTIVDHLLPHIHDLTVTLIRASVFSKVNLVKAYNINPMAADNIRKFTSTTSFGIYEFSKMPFA